LSIFKFFYKDYLMKALKIIFFILFIALVTVLALYKYGPQPVKTQLSLFFSQMGIEEWVAKITGEKIIPQEDELLIKTDVFYYWKDIEGNEHYASTLNEVPVQYREQMKTINSNEIGGNIKIMNKQEEADFLNKNQEKPLPVQFKNASFQILIYSYSNDPCLPETKAYFEKFNLPYKVNDVITNPEFASELKVKLGLDINKKYDNINFPVIEINGQIIERNIDSTDEKGRVKATSLNTAKINKILGLRATFE
jgi:hypothetical protein